LPVAVQSAQQFVDNGRFTAVYRSFIAITRYCLSGVGDSGWLNNRDRKVGKFDMSTEQLAVPADEASAAERSYAVAWTALTLLLATVAVVAVSVFAVFRGLA
jgi:hypothetical protein